MMTNEQIISLQSQWVIKRQYFKLKPKPDFKDKFLSYYTYDIQNLDEWFNDRVDEWDDIESFINRIASSDYVYVYFLPLQDSSPLGMDPQDADLFEKYDDNYVLKFWMFEDYEEEGVK